MLTCAIIIWFSDTANWFLLSEMLLPWFYQRTQARYFNILQGKHSNIKTGLVLGYVLSTREGLSVACQMLSFWMLTKMALDKLRKSMQIFSYPKFKFEFGWPLVLLNVMRWSDSIVLSTMYWWEGHSNEESGVSNSLYLWAP